MQQLWNLGVDWTDPQELEESCLNLLVCLFAQENSLFVYEEDCVFREIVLTISSYNLL